MEANVFAGHPEYFSSAITSTSRIANIYIGQQQSKKIDSLVGNEPKESRYGHKIYMDNIAQADTDSVAGESVINVNGTDIKIEDFFKKTNGNTEKNSKNNYTKHLTDDCYTLSLNKETGNIENKKIKYVMAHKVKKRMYKIKSEGQEVTVTEDHSVIIKRSKTYMDIKPNDIKKGDKILIFLESDYNKEKMIETDNFIVQDSGIQKNWVYDIEVENNHNFFANNICVHNSIYLSLEKLIKKKFGAEYEEEAKTERLIEFTKNYINKVAMPLVREKLDGVYAYALNAYLPDKLQEDPEVICDCLPANAVVETKDGSRKIEEITILDEVISYNEKLGVNEYKDVLGTRKIKTNKKMLTISNGNKTIRCTEDHRIYTKNRGYIFAKELLESDDLQIN